MGAGLLHVGYTVVKMLHSQRFVHLMLHINLVLVSAEHLSRASGSSYTCPHPLKLVLIPTDQTPNVWESLKMWPFRA